MVSFLEEPITLNLLTKEGQSRSAHKLPLAGRHLPDVRSSQYGKGIYLEALEDSVVFVTELAVDHLDARSGGFGITRGCYFRVDEGSPWHPIEHPE